MPSAVTVLLAANLKYVNSGGVDTYYASTNNNAQVPGEVFDDIEGRSGVSVGGFIGSVNDITNSDININTKTSNYRFDNIHIVGKNNEVRCNIIGPNSAGGIIGATAMTYGTVKGYPGVLLSNGQNVQFAPSLLNCSYKWINVTAQLSAGGMIGHVNARKGTPTFSSLGVDATNENAGWYTSFIVTKDKYTVGEESTIKAEAWGSVAGGIYAATGMRNLFNSPDVDNKTGLTIKDQNEICTLKLNKVNVSAYTVNRVVKTVTSGVNANNGNNEKAAGGITARHGSQNPSWYYKISLSSCTISTGKFSSDGKNVDDEYAGGIVGSGYTRQKLVMAQCMIIDTKIDSENSGGFLGYGYDYANTNTYFKYHLSDSKVEDSTINGNYCSGGFVGKAQGNYYFYNLMIKNTSITGNEKNRGRLLGNAKVNSNGTGFELYAAGISVFIDPLNSSKITLPNQDLDQTSYIGYVSYADYAGTETEVTGKQNPYVTVNPNYTLTGTAHENVPDKMITGDAVGKIQGDRYNSVAARIWTDSKTGATQKKNLAPYANTNSIVNATEKTTSEVSTFREVQGYSDTEWTSTDLPVLVLKGNDASAIEDYLNVITNGGYGVAKSGGKITVDKNSVSVYYYDKDSKTFYLATDSQLATNPASIFYENGKFNVRSRSFDNTLDRFSLVEVNFNVTVNGEQRTYTVSLPVVVIRELQFDYMATFSYGKEFMPSTYNSINTHLLESTGNPFTIYLTYQYNREREDYREYDWQTYMNDGGSMLSIDKVLNFSSGLPSGTQMILVDCQNGNQAYQFTTTSNNTNDVKMSEFISLTGGTAFQSSMADVIGVTVSGPTASGKFVKIDETDKENSTIRLNGAYYRLYDAETDNRPEITRYDLTVPSLKDNVPTENYYLVITVPDQDNAEYYINGSLTSSLSWTMPSSGTKLHRYLTENKDDKVDDSNNTESTYQISTGYRQKLVSKAGSEKIDLSVSTNKMQVKLQDTITFSNKQVYGDSDQLFLKFTANLKEHKSENEIPTSEERQFPVGTSGTVKFYVKDPETNNYYKWDGTAWNSEKVIEGQDLPVAASYLWESNGRNMELLLADGQNALDLAAVRQAIKGNKTVGESNIVVTAEMDVDFETSVVLEAAIPGSDKAGADIWAQMHYISQISTQKESIGYSSMRVTEIDNAGYYRNVMYQAVLSMDAANIDQLGVNPLQLVEKYQETIGERNASRIDLNAVLDLSNIQDVESLLKSTSSVTFTLSLHRRKGNSYVDVQNILEVANYVAFKWDNNSDNTDWSWAISKEEYYANNSVNTSGIFDGTQFSFPITAYVFTDKKDFANYRINLSVSFDGVQQQPSLSDSDAYVVYTYACIKPTFYTFNSSD